MVLITCLSGTTIAVLPVFLLGALAGEIQDDLRGSELVVGALVAGFFAVSAIASVPAAHFVTLFGWPVGMLGVGAAVVVGCLGMAWGHNLTVLAVSLAICGLGNAMNHPAANLGLVTVIRHHRQGLAFGIKQAAIPICTLLAGAALPLLAIQLGWRAPFLLVAIAASALALVAALSMARRNPRSSKSVRTFGPQVPSRNLRWLAIAAGLGSAAASSMGTFLVLYALHRELSASVAGALLIIGSLTNIIVRVLAGWRADRRSSGHLKLVAVMMLTGSAGVLIIASASNAAVLALGVVIAFGAGWGWNGLLHFGTMRMYSKSAAQVTGILQAFMFLGSAMGPLVFGLVAETLSFAAAWFAVSVWLVLAAICLLWFRVQYRRHRAP